MIRAGAVALLLTGLACQQPRAPLDGGTPADPVDAGAAADGATASTSPDAVGAGAAVGAAATDGGAADARAAADGGAPAERAALSAVDAGLLVLRRPALEAAVKLLRERNGAVRITNTSTQGWTGCTVFLFEGRAATMRSLPAAFSRALSLESFTAKPEAPELVQAVEIRCAQGSVTLPLSP